MTRVTIANLEIAASWLEEYNDGEALDETSVEIFKVAAWLREEVARRHRQNLINNLAKDNGLKPSDPRVKRAVDAAILKVKS